MKIAYKSFISTTTISEYPIYLILGNPYHLQNEVEFRLENYYKKKLYIIKKYVVDSDFDLGQIKDDFENYSLFADKKVILLNIISNTIPKTLSEYLMEISIVPDIVIILKLCGQSPSFKKTKIYSKIDTSGCIIEVFELSGSNLNDWVRRKFTRNKINFSEELFKKLIDKNEGNTSAISQEIYKMSLLNIKDVGTYFDYIQKEYKFTEFDLIDSIVSKNLKKTIRILNYLRSIKSSEVYILFLLSNEIKKIYYLVNGLSPQPYIPNYKKNVYSKFSKDYSKQHLMDLIQYCYAIDKAIKLGSTESNIWNNFEILITAFVLKKPLIHQSNTEIV